MKLTTFLLGAMLLAGAPAARAADGAGTTSNTPTNPEIERLRADLEIAKLRADIAEQEKKRLQQAPGSEIAALEGKTTIDDKLSFEVESEAYGQLSKAASIMAADLAKAGPKTVIILDGSLAAAFRNLRTYEALSRNLHEGGAALLDEYNLRLAAAPPAPPPSPGIASPQIGLATAGSAVRSAIDLLSLFRADVEFKGREVTIAERALIACVAKHLTAGGIAVVHPKTLPPGLLAPIDLSKEPYASLVQLRAIRNALNAGVATTEAKEAGETAEAAKVVHRDFRARFAGHVKLIDDYMAALTKTDDAGVSPFSNLITAAAVAALVPNGGTGTYLLDTEVSKAGGSYKITRTLWNSIFLGPNLKHSGGVIVSYSLFNPDATIVRSDVVNPGQKFKRI